MKCRFCRQEIPKEAKKRLFDRKHCQICDNLDTQLRKHDGRPVKERNILIRQTAVYRLQYQALGRGGW